MKWWEEILLWSSTGSRPSAHVMKGTFVSTVEMAQEKELEKQNVTFFELSCKYSNIIISLVFKIFVFIYFNYFMSNKLMHKIIH